MRSTANTAQRAHSTSRRLVPNFLTGVERVAVRFKELHAAASAVDHGESVLERISISSQGVRS
jgi:hypothetical protein